MEQEQEKKYCFAGEKTIELADGEMITMHQIKALRTIKNGDICIQPGELGGWIETEDNLSQLPGDNSWIYPDGIVIAGAVVRGNAIVAAGTIVGNAVISGDAVITETEPYSTFISGHVRVFDALVQDCLLWDETVIMGHANIYDSMLEGNVLVSGHPDIRRSHITGLSQVDGYARVWDSELSEHSLAAGHSIVSHSMLCGMSSVLQSARAEGVHMYDHAAITGRSSITKAPAGDAPVFLVDDAVLQDASCEGGRVPVFFCGGKTYSGELSIDPGSPYTCFGESEGQRVTELMEQYAGEPEQPEDIPER
jgi:hypothetical protein